MVSYSFTLSTDTMLFSTSVQERTIQLRIPVICQTQTYMYGHQPAAWPVCGTVSLDIREHVYFGICGKHKSTNVLSLSNHHRYQCIKVTVFVLDFNIMKTKPQNVSNLERMWNCQTHDTSTKFCTALHGKDGCGQNQQIPQKLQIHCEPPEPGMYRKLSICKYPFNIKSNL